MWKIILAPFLAQPIKDFRSTGTNIQNESKQDSDFFYRRAGMADQARWNPSLSVTTVLLLSLPTQSVFEWQISAGRGEESDPQYYL